MLTFCCTQFLCWFFLSPQNRCWYTEQGVTAACSITHLPSHTAVRSSCDAQRGEIINSTATEAQNHIHSDCHWLLLLAFEIYDDHLIMKFLSWYFSHKSRKKAGTQSEKGVRTAEIKNHLQVWLCSLHGCSERMCGSTLKDFMDTACSLTDLQTLNSAVSNNKKVNKNMHESRLVL